MVPCSFSWASTAAAPPCAHLGTCLKQTSDEKTLKLARRRTHTERCLPARSNPRAWWKMVLRGSALGGSASITTSKKNVILRTREPPVRAPLTPHGACEAAGRTVLPFFAVQRQPHLQCICPVRSIYVTPSSLCGCATNAWLQVAGCGLQTLPVQHRGEGSTVGVCSALRPMACEFMRPCMRRRMRWEERFNLRPRGIAKRGGNSLVDGTHT